jgi:restriction endonuclease Mrr
LTNENQKENRLDLVIGRGVFTITDRGKKVLAQNPPKIDLKLLEQFPEFLGVQSQIKDGG